MDEEFAFARDSFDEIMNLRIVVVSALISGLSAMKQESHRRWSLGI